MSHKLTDKANRDLKLINKALTNGDPLAYSQLAKLYLDPLYFMIYEKVNDKELAQDLTIETLSKAFMKLHLYSSDYAFSTWLFTIARNNCIDYFRKHKLPTVSIENMMVNSDGSRNNFDLKLDSPNPEKLMIKKQRIKILRSIVNQLKPKYRDLIKLRYYKEMSYTEISEALGIPLGTVKAQLHRSREQLFTIMSELKDSY